jgi:hypothetical protein
MTFKVKVTIDQGHIELNLFKDIIQKVLVLTFEENPFKSA